jgi:nitroreductase
MNPDWFKAVSLIACLYMMVARLGETGSYLAAFNIGALLLMAWALGYYSSTRNGSEQN